MASVTPYALRNTIINYISTLKSTTYVQVDIEKVVRQSDGSYEVEGTYEAGILPDSKHFTIVLDKDLNPKEINLAATRKS
jgi:type IV secretory pathway TrbF-like protein